MSKTFLVLILALLSGLFGCISEKPYKKYRIGFSQCCDDPWRDVMRQEMYRELAFHPELNLDIRVAFNDSKQQIEQIQELVKVGIDILVVSPNESKPLTPIIEEVYKSGIPVILIDRKTESEQFSAYIGADNYEIGTTAAKYLASRFESSGKIMELQLGMTMTPARDRSKGFHDALLKFPKMQIVAQLEMANGLDSLRANFLKTLKNHPETTIIFAHNDYLAENAFNWATEIGMSDQLFFVGIDGIPGIGKGIQAVEDGTLNASLLYPTGGAEAIRLALSILSNLPFDKKNVLQTIVINEDNARILHLQMKKVESLQRNIDDQLKAVDDLNSIYRNQRIYILVLVLSLLLAIVLGGILYKSLRTKEEINRSLEQKTKEALEHEQQIMQISDELSLATQAKVDFFTNISHEFRTPLTLILGYLEGLIKTGINGPEAKQDLGLVRKNALRLLRLVNQLMDLRKVESGKMAIRATENDLVAFCQEIVGAYQKMAEKRNIQLGFFSVEKHVPVWFDVNMLDKVLFNLLSNAFKFTPDGGKIQVAVVVDPISGNAVVKVEDTGKGMAKEHIDHVFDRFFQGSANKSSGTGLGLSLSKELVGQHSGSINLWSEPGKGARFEVIIPLGNSHFRPDQLVADTPEGISYDETLLYFEGESAENALPLSDKSLGEQTILVIEDNDDLRRFLRKQFGNYYQIIEASDGIVGYEKALEDVPDLIIADIAMPGRDGLTLAKMLKSDLRTSHIPIVLLTAKNTIEQKIEGIQTGADAYVTKPFNLVFLSEVVKNLLQSRENLRELFSGALHPGKIPSGIGEIDQKFLKKFTGFIDQQFADQNLTVERLSEEFGLSRVQLFRKTKALLGESPIDYIQHIRLTKAGELLLESQLTIAEVAYQTGYNSPGYFSTAFKGKYACSPTEWRDRNHL